MDRHPRAGRGRTERQQGVERRAFALRHPRVVAAGRGEARGCSPARDSRITAEGVVIVKAQRYRSQDKNRDDALARLQELVDAAATVPRARKADETDARIAAPARRQQGEARPGQGRRAAASSIERVDDGAAATSPRSPAGRWSTTASAPRRSGKARATMTCARTSPRCCRPSKGAPPFAILDFGCGPGRDLKTFADLGHAPVGLEGAAPFADMARAHSGCEVWQQDFLALDLPAERFDGVFANAALFHVPTRGAAARAARVACGAEAARRAVQFESARQ